MNTKRVAHMTLSTLFCSLFGFLGGCGGTTDTASPPPPAVAIATNGPNAIAAWNEIASTVVQMPAATTGTESERAPNYALDLTTLHVAMYDAAVAITRTHTPYAIKSADDVNVGASLNAAVNAAAYTVMLGLFPTRASAFQATYDSRVNAIADGSEKSRGLELGAEVGRGILVLRANDGRLTTLAPYVPGTTPGKFRGSNPINRTMPMTKPFALTSTAQFRAPAPPALDSSAYDATDVNETKAYGGATSAVRTAAQTEIARFHTEPPTQFWPRNLRQFASASSSLSENARLMAMLYVAHADATLACFDSKYTYEFWRPSSAITLAATANNAAVIADARWTPVVTTPNHPEYPAAPTCVGAALLATLNSFYGTNQVSFKFDSTVANTTVHSYASTDAMLTEIGLARIYGGMHFRRATDAGAKLGASVGDWVTQNYFKPKKVALEAHTSCESTFCVIAYLIRAKPIKSQ